MLRFLNFGRFVKTESIIIRQPSVLTRDLSGTSWLEQAGGGKGKKGSKGSRGGKSYTSGVGKGMKSSNSNSSGGGSRFFGSKLGSNMSSSGSGSVGTSVCFDKGSNRFTLDLGNNQVARIDYKSIGRNKIELYHTEVPNELRGRGIGKALAKGALEQAMKSKMKVKLSCSYLINNLDKFADAKLKKIVEN